MVPFLEGCCMSDLARLTWSNVNLSEGNQAIRFNAEEDKGRTPKAKVQVPIHEALENTCFRDRGSVASTASFV
jgi:hypothetical protein